MGGGVRARRRSAVCTCRAGQELTHFKLLPGEEVRSPLIVLQFWKGDWIVAQNVWRRWMMAHTMPRPGGKLPPPQLVASSSRQYDEMIKANEANQIMFIDRYLRGRHQARLLVDGRRLVRAPRRRLAARRHLGGGHEALPAAACAPISRSCAQQGHEDPRLVRAGARHGRHLAGATIIPSGCSGGAKGGLLNLGNADARQWLIEHVDQLLTEQGIDLYRQDFNMDPLDYWRGDDAPDRQGITEIKHVTGYLAYWDELRRRHPNMLIDSCACGGRRNDLETMRRAVPLWRSDYAYEPIGHQCMTYGISLWLPYHGTGTVAARNAPYYGSGSTPVEPYAFWSNAGPSLGFGIDMRVHETSTTPRCAGSSASGGRSARTTTATSIR